MTPRCFVAMYHYVRNAAATPFPRLNALAVADFDLQLQWLGAHHAVLSYPAFEAAIEARRPFARSAALLTFDDGLVDHRDIVFPRLRARNWSGVFFLAGAALDDPPRVLSVHKTHFLIETLGAERFGASVRDLLAGGAAPSGRPIERRPEVYRYDTAAPQVDMKHLLNYELPYGEADAILSALFARYLGDEEAFARSLYLSPEMIREMAAGGMTFGFHTERHRVLARLSAGEQRAELARGLDRIRALTGQASVPFCYPYGHLHTFNDDTLSLLRDSGYGTAFTTVRRDLDPATDDRLLLPRYDTRDLPPFVPFAAHA